MTEYECIACGFDIESLEGECSNCKEAEVIYAKYEKLLYDADALRPELERRGWL